MARLVPKELRIRLIINYEFVNDSLLRIVFNEEQCVSEEWTDLLYQKAGCVI